LNTHMTMIAALILFSSSQPLSSIPQDWKGKIQTDGKIKTIVNPKDPLYGDLKLDLKEELAIGREDDDRYLFNRVRNIAVDDDGRIYVVDIRNRRVQVFDGEGRFLMTLGRSGQGPGEFQSPAEVRFGPANSIFVKDSIQKIEIFSKDGRYEKTMTVPHILESFYFNMNGEVLGAIWTVDESGHRKEIVSLDENFRIKAHLFSKPYLPASKTTNGVYVMTQTGYEQGLLLNQRPNGFIVGDSSDYILSLLDEKGSLQLIVKKDVSPQPIPADIRKKYQDYPLPEHAPFYDSFLSDDLGRIYVFTREEEAKDKERRVADVFNQDGYYLYRIELPGTLQVIKKGILYALVIDKETELEQIKRFKIMNWDSMRMK